MTASEEWPPSAEELIEDPQLFEAVRETDPDYLDELVEDYPELREMF